MFLIFQGYCKTMLTWLTLDTCHFADTGVFLWNKFLEVELLYLKNTGFWKTSLKPKVTKQP